MTEAMLVGFGVGSASLQLIHKLWLDENIVPILFDGGRAAVAGYASRTGSVAYNLQLSAQRAKRVAAHLRDKTFNRAHLSTFDLTLDPAHGESAAAAAGQRDGTEDRNYRAVHVKAWRKPVPPPPPRPKAPAPRRQVVSSRRWYKVNYNMPNEPGGWPPTWAPRSTTCSGPTRAQSGTWPFQATTPSTPSGMSSRSTGR